MQRARDEGYARGAGEACLFNLAVGKASQALDWIGTAIDEARVDLVAQHALEREIEAFDMSCRIAFLVALT